MFLLPVQCGDDEEGIDRLVVASSESYVRNSTPQEQPREVCCSVATRTCTGGCRYIIVRRSRPMKTTGFRMPRALSSVLATLGHYSAGPSAF